MSYEDRKQDFSREPITIVEVEADYCQLNFSIAPCTATGTGDAKCYNTEASCQDLENINLEPKVYRFCTDVSPLPVGLDAIPSLRSVIVSPSRIDLEGGLGVRSSATVTFNDHPASDLGIDKYAAERSYIALERGTYWTKFRARNPFYQGRKLRVLYGYLVDGVFNPDNFQTRHYVIEEITASGGTARITAKDPLKLADNRRSQAPQITPSELVGNISNTVESFSVTDANLYSPGDFIRIRSEIMGVTGVSGSVIGVTRGQFNTQATTHSEGDTVQLCLHYDGVGLSDILFNLLTDFAGVDPSFIPLGRWNAEIDAFLPGLLSALITEPVGVQALLKELGEQAPHHLYWDERSQTIELAAVQPPPIDANVLDMDSNIIADSFSTSDETDMRYSTVIVYFGQFDPTEKLDETRNYQQVYARVNQDSIIRYGSNRIKTIFSRWITNLNKAASIRLAARIGRRFGVEPRNARFSLDAKDSATWAGQTKAIRHRDITDFDGLPKDTGFQIISVSPRRERYDYEAIEYTFDKALPGDVFDEDLTVVIAGDENNINLRAAFDTLFPEPESGDTVRIIIESGTVIGSATGGAAVETGNWPSGVELIYDNRGRTVGRGGNGAVIDGVGGNGGTAISMQYPLTLINSGIIGGGGGGGGFTTDIQGSVTAKIPGSGGAGRLSGGGGGIIEITGEDSVTFANQPQPGGVVGAGAAGEIFYTSGGEGFIATGVQGGGLGQNGTNSTGNGGTAGSAIITNGNTLTQTVAGDIRGAIV